MRKTWHLIAALVFFFLLWVMFTKALVYGYYEHEALKTGQGLLEFSGTVDKLHTYQYKEYRRDKSRQHVLLYVTPKKATQEIGLFLMGNYFSDVDALHSPYRQLLKQRVHIYYREKNRAFQERPFSGVLESERYHLPHLPYVADAVCVTGGDGKETCDPSLEDMLRGEQRGAIAMVVMWVILTLGLVAGVYGAVRKQRA